MLSAHTTLITIIMTHSLCPCCYSTVSCTPDPTVTPPGAYRISAGMSFYFGNTCSNAHVAANEIEMFSEEKAEHLH
jgi:hypothetical protein